MKVCFAEQMRDIDKKAVEVCGIPSIVLMENAAIACVNHLTQLDLNRKKTAVFCGKGNNGGDGLAIARHLINLGIDTSVFLVCGDDFSGDALINYKILLNMGADISEITDINSLKYIIMSHDVIVDAIFGTGIKGEITGICAYVIDSINRFSKFTFSVDIPSGVNADNGRVENIAVNADMTVTFGAYKTGMLSFPGSDYCGKIILENISIPKRITENISINIIDTETAASRFPKRTNDSHKGDYGKLLIIGASKGLTGAAAMSAEAALKCGTGLITLGVPKSVNDILEAKLTEPMTAPLSDTDGIINISSLPKIFELTEHCNALLFGPGLGRADDIKTILRKILKISKIPIIIDADGLFALSQDMDMLSDCSCSLIFTPHEMEFSRISGYSLEEIKKDRIGTSKKFATEFGVTLVLKGAKTIVTFPDGTQYINITGNNGMATGGSGDVLAGMIGAFAARGCTEYDSALLGVYYHSLAGDKAAELFGKNALTPSDIISSIHLILPVE